MRPSPLRHPVAVLRLLLGLSQQGFANLTRRSRPTVKAVELCKLSLSEKFAEDISAATGIDPRWLLAGDPSTPPRRLDGPGDYSREYFEEWLAVQHLEKNVPPSALTDPDAIASEEGKRHGEALAAILRSAISAGTTKYAVAAYRIEKFLRQMERDFGTAESVHHPRQSPPRKIVDSGSATMRRSRPAFSYEGFIEPTEPKTEA